MSEREDVEADALAGLAQWKTGPSDGSYGQIYVVQEHQLLDWLAEHDAEALAPVRALADVIETLPRNEFGDQHYLAVEAAYANVKAHLTAILPSRAAGGVMNTTAPPEVLIGALANMIAAESQARDECRDDLRRSWHQGRVSAFMDAKRQTESWVAHERLAGP